MIDVQAMRERLNEAKRRYIETAKQYGIGSEEARQAFTDMAMAVYGNARDMQPKGQ